jgi:hypothetical protein
MFLCYVVWSMCSLWVLLMFGCRCPTATDDDDDFEDVLSHRTPFVPDHVLPPRPPRAPPPPSKKNWPPVHRRTNVLSSGVEQSDKNLS